MTTEEDIKEKPLEEIVLNEGPLKQLLVNYVGNKLQPEDDSVTLEMVVNTVADEFPEFVLAVAEENFMRGYQQCLQDVKFVNEVFADRTYLDDGRLTPRTEAGSLIEDQDSSLHQVLQMILEHTVTSVRGKRIPLEAETICIHGDGAHALEFAAFIHQALNERGIEIRSV